VNSSAAYLLIYEVSRSFPPLISVSHTTSYGLGNPNHAPN
jgi:hypothetical protein